MQPVVAAALIACILADNVRSNLSACNTSTNSCFIWQCHRGVCYLNATPFWSVMPRLGTPSARALRAVLGWVRKWPSSLQVLSGGVCIWECSQLPHAGWCPPRPRASERGDAATLGVVCQGGHCAEDSAAGLQPQVRTAGAHVPAQSGT